MGGQTEKEIHLRTAQTIYSNIRLFELNLRAKKRKPGDPTAWKKIEIDAKLTDNADDVWRNIMTKFDSGNSKGLSPEDVTLFEEVKKILRWFTIVKIALDGAENSEQSESEKAVTPTKPGPSAAKSNSTTADLDEQNKKERQEKTDELTAIAKKLKLEMETMEDDLSNLHKRYKSMKLDTVQLANKLDELKKIE